MGMSKKDLSRQHGSIKREIEALELIVKKDPLKKNIAAHEKLAELKKKLG